MRSRGVKNNSQRAYKLVRKGKDGNIYPLFVNGNEPFQKGKWMEATPGPMNEKGQVKSKLGGLAYRPGYHCSDIPYVTHIGKKDPRTGRIAYMDPEHVWVEVEVKDKIDYQPEANRNGIHKNGKFVPRDADLDYVPKNGFYRYKTNPNMTGDWIIAGDMKIIRTLSDEEVEELCAEQGLTPLPRWPGKNNNERPKGFLISLIKRR